MTTKATDDKALKLKSLSQTKTKTYLTNLAKALT